MRKLVVEDQVESTLSLLDGSLQIHVTRPTQRQNQQSAQSVTKSERYTGNDPHTHTLSLCAAGVCVCMCVHVLTQVSDQRHLRSCPETHRNTEFSSQHPPPGDRKACETSDWTRF